MPFEAFLMTGAAAPFTLAEPCPVMDGPHCGNPEVSAFMVADATTRDGTATIRVVMWRCRYCGVLVTGIGHPRGNPDSSRADRVNTAAVDAQEFTWLQEHIALLGQNGNGYAE